MPRRVPSQQTLYAAFLFLSAAQAYTGAHKRMIKHIIIYSRCECSSQAFVSA